MTYLLLVFMTAVWGVNFVVIKSALAHLQPLAFNGIRFLMAAMAMMAIAGARGALRVDRGDLWRLLALGLLGNFAYQMSFIEGIARTRAGNASLILASVPVLIALSSHLLGRERHGWRVAVALALSSAGITLVVLSGRSAVGFEGTLLGDLLVLTGATCWALFTVMVRPLVDRYGVVPVTAWSMLSGAVLLILIGVPQMSATPWRSVPPIALAQVIYSSLGALVLAYLIWIHGVRRIGPTRTAVFSYLTPVTALLVAWPVLGEVPNLAQGAGAVCIFTGVALAQT